MLQETTVSQVEPSRLPEMLYTNGHSESYLPFDRHFQAFFNNVKAFLLRRWEQKAKTLRWGSFCGKLLWRATASSSAQNLLDQSRYEARYVSSGLVVMGGDLYSRDHEFESQHRILDGLFHIQPTLEKLFYSVIFYLNLFVVNGLRE